MIFFIYTLKVFYKYFCIQKAIALVFLNLLISVTLQSSAQMTGTALLARLPAWLTDFGATPHSSLYPPPPPN